MNASFEPWGLALRIIPTLLTGSMPLRKRGGDRELAPPRWTRRGAVRMPGVRFRVRSRDNAERELPRPAPTATKNSWSPKIRCLGKFLIGKKVSAGSGRRVRVSTKVNCPALHLASSAKRNVCLSRGTAQRLMMRGHRSTGGAAIRAEPGVTIWRSSFRCRLTTIKRPTDGARVALSVMANAPKITSSFVGKENVGTEIYLLRRRLIRARRERSMSASIVTSTSASSGTAWHSPMTRAGRSCGRPALTAPRARS